ncbi:uncharacterized protein LOC129580317 [Sitodiplosis mosellana]|uniref:uncharacterized protein LOC129580317 n=1 Tax=Sitodiplosis mosellana TaxID=263140 RepID=UPI002443D99B|nr:uncharacterized protein LOC129580317 [Sitodiplosis mosellana]
MRSLKEKLEDVLKDEQRDQSLLSSRTAEEFPVNSAVAFSLRNLGVHNLSHIQVKMLTGLLIQKKNMVVVDEAGGGKTFGAIIAILSRIDANRMNPQALFVCATYEAALQVAAKMLALAVRSQINITTLMANKNVQIGQKADGHIIVGTPKEIVSFSIMRNFNIEDIECIIIDDVDIVNTSDLFRSHVMGKLDRSALKMFIASQIHTAAPYGNDMEIVPEYGTRNITETFLNCADIVQKIKAIVTAYTVLVKYKSQGIIFFRTRENLDLVASVLTLKKCAVSMLHSKMTFEDRDLAIRKFGWGQSTLLLTTNVLARSVSFEAARLVINFDIPDNGLAHTFDGKSYHYRIGRSSRFGQRGLAISFVSGDDQQIFNNLLAQHPDLSEIYNV